MNLVDIASKNKIEEKGVLWYDGQTLRIINEDLEFIVQGIHQDVFTVRSDTEHLDERINVLDERINVLIARIEELEKRLAE